jgi:16S rRNA (cytosine1402-N4)-methyltransferase
VADGSQFGSNSAPGGAHGGEEFGHVPVLLKPAIDFLAIRRGGTYVDATVGLGGHSFEIAKRLGAQGHLIGLDKDPQALAIARERLGQASAGLEHDSFANLAGHVAPGTADGVLADLGVSSMQLKDAARGFSFQAEGPLDMRMDPQAGLTADQVVNQADEPTLAGLIYEFGEERRSRRIARAIVRARPITTTVQLARVVAAAARSMKTQRLHPATLTFQALRIFVNRELDDLKALLEAAPTALAKGGRLVVISFHSLEDRMVKDALRDGARRKLYELLTRKPVVAGREIEANPRSRSAKLRAARRI